MYNQALLGVTHELNFLGSHPTNLASFLNNTAIFSPRTFPSEVLLPIKCMNHKEFWWIRILLTVPNTYLHLQPPFLTPWVLQNTSERQLKLSALISLEVLKWQTPEYMASKTLNYYVVPSSCDDHLDIPNFHSKFLTTFMYTMAEYMCMFTVLAFYKI